MVTSLKYFLISSTYVSVLRLFCHESANLDCLPFPERSPSYVEKYAVPPGLSAFAAWSMTFALACSLSMTLSTLVHVTVSAFSLCTLCATWRLCSWSRLNGSNTRFSTPRSLSQSVALSNLPPPMSTLTVPGCQSIFFMAPATWLSDVAAEPNPCERLFSLFSSARNERSDGSVAGAGWAGCSIGRNVLGLMLFWMSRSEKRCQGIRCRTFRKQHLRVQHL